MNHETVGVVDRLTEDYVRVKLPVSPLLAVCILMSTAAWRWQMDPLVLGCFETGLPGVFYFQSFKSP